MTRKFFWLAVALLMTLASVAGCVGSSRSLSRSSSSAGAAQSRPNFVFVLTDDLSQNLISHMPHVMALEKSGITFPRYDVVDSLCCPSRSSIFTGEYPHDDGVFTNSGRDGGYNAYVSHHNEPRSFAVALKKAGYRTAMMGKYLNGYDPKNPRNPIPPGWDHWDVTGNGYPEFGYTLNQDGTLHYYGNSAADYLTDVLSGRANSFLNSAASSGKPFMLEVATFAPHHPYTPESKYKGTAAGVSYPKTPAYERLPASPPSWLRGRPPLGAAENRNITQIYQKRLEADRSVDDMIGSLEKELAAKGMAKNTYFVFSSDNGYHMGEYRLSPGKQTAFDTDINVPLIVHGPGVPAGRVASQPASNIDLNPTFETLAGLTVPSTVDGHSLAAVWHGQNPADWRQAILIEHHRSADTRNDPDQEGSSSGDPPSYEAVRTATALYVRYDNGEQEYYNTVTDPYELNNIASRGIPRNLVTALKEMKNCHNGKACWAAAHLNR